jgi:hypothetical protein
VAIAAFAAASVINPTSVLVYINLVLPEDAHTRCSGKLTVVGTHVKTRETITCRRWRAREVLVATLAAAADPVGPSSAFWSWLYTAPPLNPAWPATTAWSPTLDRAPGVQPALVLGVNVKRAGSPGAFNSAEVPQHVAWKLVAGCGRAGY